MQWNRVVLPAPLGPTTAMNAPRAVQADAAQHRHVAEVLAHFLQGQD